MRISQNCLTQEQKLFQNGVNIYGGWWWVVLDGGWWLVMLDGGGLCWMVVVTLLLKPPLKTSFLNVENLSRQHSMYKYFYI